MFFGVVRDDMRHDVDVEGVSVFPHKAVRLWGVVNAREGRFVATDHVG